MKTVMGMVIIPRVGDITDGCNEYPECRRWARRGSNPRPYGCEPEAGEAGTGDIMVMDYGGAMMGEVGSSGMGEVGILLGGGSDQ